MRREPAWNYTVYNKAYTENPIEELNMLKMQAETMNNNLENINRRIMELEKSSE